MHKTRIKHIVNRMVLTTPATTRVAEVIRIMSGAGISSLVVVEGKKPLGIFTERDIVKAVNKRVNLEEIAISEVMSRLVATISGEISIYDAYKLLLVNRYRHHVVTDRRGRVVGVVTLTDMVNHLGLEYFVELRKIEQIMTREVVTVTAATPLKKVVALMAEKAISCVIVTERSKPAGIFSERDMARLVANGTKLEGLRIDQVMTAPVRTVKHDASVHSVVSAMQRFSIRRIVVVDRSGKLAGLITQSDILKELEGKYIEVLKRVIREKEAVLLKTTRNLVDKGIYLESILSSAIDMAIVATDSDFRIRYFNPKAEEVFGVRREEVFDHPVDDLFVLEGVPKGRLVKAREIVARKGAYRFIMQLDRGGGLRSYENRVSGIIDGEQRLVGFVLMMRDVTERKRTEATIRHLAFHDALTGLPNRVLLNERLDQALAHASRYGSSGVLMMLDLDRFKDINDTLGHSIGDLLLKEVAIRLQGAMRKSDTVARMGGDEFVVLVPTISSQESVAAIAEKIGNILRQPCSCDGHELVITTSIGVALFPGDGADAGTLLKNADIALYRAKDLGRDTCQFYGDRR